MTINPGTENGGMLTKIGDNCLIMASAHVAHDAIIGNNVVMANYVGIAGCHFPVSNDAVTRLCGPAACPYSGIR